MDANLRAILELLAVPVLLAAGALIQNFLLKRTRSRDSEADDLANFRRELLQENRLTKAEAEAWQEKFYATMINVTRIEGIVTAYLKLQATHQSSLLERARLEAEVEALRGRLALPTGTEGCR